MPNIERDVLAFIRKNPDTSVAEIAWGLGKKGGLKKSGESLEGTVDQGVIDAVRVLTAQGKLISVSTGISAL